MCPSWKLSPLALSLDGKAPLWSIDSGSESRGALMTSGNEWESLWKNNDLTCFQRHKIFIREHFSLPRSKWWMNWVLCSAIQRNRMELFMYAGVILHAIYTQPKLPAGLFTFIVERQWCATDTKIRKWIFWIVGNFFPRLLLNKSCIMTHTLSAEWQRCRCGGALASWKSLDSQLNRSEPHNDWCLMLMHIFMKLSIKRHPIRS